LVRIYGANIEINIWGVANGEVWVGCENITNSSVIRSESINILEGYLMLFSYEL
jgi:hypothetical protein